MIYIYFPVFYYSGECMPSNDLILSTINRAFIYSPNFNNRSIYFIYKTFYFEYRMAKMKGKKA